MSARKRSAKSQLNYESFSYGNDEDEEEEPSQPAAPVAPKFERKILNAKRRANTAVDRPAAFTGFGGFGAPALNSSTVTTSSKTAPLSDGLFGNAAARAKSSLAVGSVFTPSPTTTKASTVTTNGNHYERKTTEISTTSVVAPRPTAHTTNVSKEDTSAAQSWSSTATRDKRKTAYMSNLKGLNMKFLSWIQQHLNANPHVDLRPTFADYDRHFKRLEELFLKKRSAETDDQPRRAKQSRQDETLTAVPKVDPPPTAFGPKPAYNFGAPTSNTLKPSLPSVSSSNTSAVTSNSGFKFGATSPNTSTTGALINNSVSADGGFGFGANMDSTKTKSSIVLDSNTSGGGLFKFGSSSASGSIERSGLGLEKPDIVLSAKISSDETAEVATDSVYIATSTSNSKLLFGAPPVSKPTGSLFSTESIGSSKTERSGPLFPPIFGASQKSKPLFGSTTPVPAEESLAASNAPAVGLFGGPSPVAPSNSAGGPLFAFSAAAPSASTSSALEVVGSGVSAETEETDEPPKVEQVDVEEEGAFYSKKCKLYVKIEGAFDCRGIGTLHLKKTETGKTQLLIRASNNLGTILLNIVLNPTAPMSQSKNNVMFACIPNPPLSGTAADGLASMLVRVKTDKDAEELLAMMQESN